MSNSNNTESPKKSVKVFLPLLLIYLVASGSVFEKISTISGTIMIAIGLMMARYIYVKHRGTAKQSIMAANQPLETFIWNTYIPFILKHWVVISLIVVAGTILSTAYITTVLTNH